jgi:hypothetical protein
MEATLEKIVDSLGVGHDQETDRGHGTVRSFKSVSMPNARQRTDQWTETPRASDTHGHSSHKTSEQDSWKQWTPSKTVSLPRHGQRRHKGVSQTPTRHRPGEQGANQVMTPDSAAAPDFNRDPIRNNHQRVHSRK